VSLRDVKELMAERGLSVDHTSIWRWAQAYGPEVEVAGGIASTLWGAASLRKSKPIGKFCDVTGAGGAVRRTTEASKDKRIYIEQGNRNRLGEADAEGDAVCRISTDIRARVVGSAGNGQPINRSRAGWRRLRLGFASVPR
jgi:hypothetical protein